MAENLRMLTLETEASQAATAAPRQFLATAATAATAATSAPAAPAAKAPHPIPVRRMRFPLPDAAAFHPLYIGGNSALSYFHTAMGLYAAYLEPFLVKSFRGVADQIRDPELRENVDRFCRQESQHYQQHADFNRIILAHGYPGLDALLAQVQRDFDGYLRHRSDRFRIGYSLGCESYTTQSALHALRIGWYDNEFTHQPWGDLFKWHMVEEIEHRHVSEDLYRHLYGGHAYRAAMCWFSQRHMLGFLKDCAQLMSKVDIHRHGPRCRITTKAKFFIAVGPLGLRLRTMWPGHSVHQLQIPAHIQVLSAQYSRQAEALL